MRFKIINKEMPYDARWWHCGISFRCCRWASPPPLCCAGINLLIIESFNLASSGAIKFINQFPPIKLLIWPAQCAQEYRKRPGAPLSNHPSKKYTSCKPPDSIYPSIAPFGSELPHAANPCHAAIYRDNFNHDAVLPSSSAGANIFWGGTPRPFRFRKNKTPLLSP